jgi:hypothetical protein
MQQIRASSLFWLTTKLVLTTGDIRASAFLRVPAGGGKAAAGFIFCAGLPLCPKSPATHAKSLIADFALAASVPTVKAIRWVGEHIRAAYFGTACFLTGTNFKFRTCCTSTNTRIGTQITEFPIHTVSVVRTSPRPRNINTFAIFTFLASTTNETAYSTVIIVVHQIFAAAGFTTKFVSNAGLYNPRSQARTYALETDLNR